MKNILLRSVIFLCSTLTLAGFAWGQQPLPRPRTQAAPVTTVTVDGSEAMFTTMCAMLAAGYEADVSSAGWSPYRAQMRDRLQHQQGPAVEVLRTYYKQHELADN